MLLSFASPARAEPWGTFVIFENEGNLYRATTHSEKGAPYYLFNAENTKGFDVVHERLIVYAPQTGGNAGDLLVRNIIDQTTKVVSTPATTGLFWSEPSWAPGGQIVGVAEGGIYSINEDGSHLRRLTSFGEWPTMNLYGYLAFSNGNNDVYLVSPVKSDEEFGHLTHISVPGPPGKENIPYFGGFLFMPSQAGLRQYYAYSDSTKTGKEAGIYPYVTEHHVAPGQVVVSCDGGAMKAVELYAEREDQFATHLPCTDVRVDHNFVGYQGNPPPGIEPTSEQLLKEFAPILKYDFQEPYRAISPAAATNTTRKNEAAQYEYVNQLKRGSRVIADPLVGRSEAETHYKPEGYFPLTLESLGKEYRAAIGSEGKKALESDYLDEHNGTEQADADAFTRPETALAYGHAVTTPSGMWLQYWYYYYYNIGEVGIDNHEGDWEMVQIYLSKNSGYLRDKMVFAQHSHSVVCQRGEYQTEGTGPGFGGRPVVHVADGTHASYPFGGDYESESPVAPDAARFNRFQEAPATTTVYFGEPLEAPHTPSWLSWPGYWGASTGSFGTGHSPRGPAFHGTQWSNPEAWASESKPCTFNQTFEAGKEAPGQQGSSGQQAPSTLQAAESGTTAVAPSAAQTGGTLVLSSPQLSGGKLSVLVNASQLKEGGVQRVILGARPIKYEHPPQTVVLEKFVGKERITFPVPVATGDTQEITGSAVLPKERIFAKAVSK